MAPTLTKTKTKGTGTKKAAAKPRTANPPAVSIKCMINGETIINGDFPANMAAKVQRAWDAMMAGAKTAKTIKANKGAGRTSGVKSTSR